MIAISAGFVVLIVALALVQFGIIAAMAMVGIVAIGIAAFLGAVVWLVTLARWILTERKPQGHF